MEFVYATKRQSRSLPMSLPRVHCTNGEAGAWLAPGSVLEPSTSPGLTPRRSARISTTTPAPPPIAILPPLPPPPPTCDGSRFAPSLYFTCPVWGQADSAPGPGRGRPPPGRVLREQQPAVAPVRVHDPGPRLGLAGPGRGRLRG